MRIEQYLTVLRKEKNIVVASEGGNLQIKANPKALTKEIVDEIKSRKKEILDFYTDTEAKGIFFSIPKSSNKSYYKLSTSHKRIYILHKFDPLSLAYNETQILRLEGKLDRDKLQKSFKNLIQRHESLRTSFHIIDNEPLQAITDGVDFEIQYIEANGDPSGKVRSFVRAFDLSKAPLIRVGVVIESDMSYLLMVDMHHIITDGVSQHIMMREFSALFNDQSLPEIKLQYRDYAEWQQSKQERLDVSRMKNFWLEKFKTNPSVLELPLDFKRPATKSHEGNAFTFDVGMEETVQLKLIAEKQGTTLFMVVFSVFNILLTKLGNQEDIVIGVPVANRQHIDLENVIGPFLNTLALRNQPKYDLTYKEFLSEVHNETLKCFEYQSYPFEDLIDKLKIVRDTSRNPLFDIMFLFQSFGSEKLELDGLSLKPYKRDHFVSKFDLSLLGYEFKGVIQMKIEYSSKLFKSKTIEKFAVYFNNIIRSIIQNIDQKISDIEIITDEEKQQLLVSFNQTSLAFEKEKALHNIFENIATKMPGKTALIFEGNRITYQSLNEKSNQIANRILKYGAKPSDRVGILMSRSVEMIASIFGILKAGCAYIPIDPEYPAARIQHVAADSRMKLMLCETVLMDRLNAAELSITLVDITLSDLSLESVENLAIRVNSSDLAYMIYTSGSTGLPKGVIIEHKSVVNFIAGIVDRVNFSQDSVILCLTTISFDIFVLETLLPLLTGSQVILANNAEQKDPAALLRLIRSHEVDFLQITPSHLSLLISNENRERIFENVKALMVGGEVFPEKLLQEVKTRYQGKIYNMYGPTETTVWSTVKDLTDQSSVNIGKPIANTRVRVMDSCQNLQPVGVYGELCIGGEGLARGYWQQDELTRKKFIYDPYHKGELIYRTGDLVRWLPNGDLEYIGRMDSQVKLRGFRIELSEIETVLGRYECIHEAVVTLTQNSADRNLAAYYLSGQELDPSVLRRYLALWLPDYMIPTYFIRMERFPLTPNGKLNKKELPAPNINLTHKFTAPANGTEQILVEVWSEVLDIKITTLSVTRSFFELGGNSLNATVLISKINKTFKVTIPLQLFFSLDTIRELAHYLESITNDSQNVGTVNENQEEFTF
ncbi:MAG: amino acid adenylation domain-containing protein [Bacteroidota bacterium]